MTRAEFEDNVTNFYDLIEWCNDNNCYVCDNIYSPESYDDYINCQLVDWARNCGGWEELRDNLDDLPIGYEYYLIDEYDDCWRGLDDSDFDEFYRDALEWGDENEIWDDDDEGEAPDDDDEEEYVEEEPEEDEPIVEMGVSFDNLFSSCSDTVQRISKDNADAKAKLEAEAEAEFDEFMVGIVAVVEGRA